MNEVNAIVTTGAGLVRTSVLLAGREAGGRQDAGSGSSPPLAGWRCRHGGSLKYLHEIYWSGAICFQCLLPAYTGKRSGPANESALP